MRLHFVAGLLRLLEVVRKNTFPMHTHQRGGLVSVVVPVYNEAATIGNVIERLRRLPFPAEIVVVDDGSTDGTSDVLREFADVRVIRHAVNRGKGAAIRSALPHCTGDIVVIQDADLEYDTEELPRVVQPLLEQQAAVVYGSRFLDGLPAGMPWPNKIMNIVLRVLVRLLYGVALTDEATCYKAVRTDLLRALNLRCERFEFCPEVTAKVIRYGFRIIEIPLKNYRPRSVRDGKKIGWRDGIEAIKTLIYWRFRRLPPLAEEAPVAVPESAFKQKEQEHCGTLDAGNASNAANQANREPQSSRRAY